MSPAMAAIRAAVDECQSNVNAVRAQMDRDTADREDPAYRTLPKADRETIRGRLEESRVKYRAALLCNHYINELWARALSLETLAALQ